MQGRTACTATLAEAARSACAKGGRGLNARNERGRYSALHYACYHGHAGRWLICVGSESGSWGRENFNKKISSGSHSGRSKQWNSGACVAVQSVIATKEGATLFGGTGKSWERLSEVEGREAWARAGCSAIGKRCSWKVIQRYQLCKMCAYWAIPCPLRLCVSVCANNRRFLCFSLFSIYICVESVVVAGICRSAVVACFKI